jgi:hypothetical protein
MVAANACSELTPYTAIATAIASSCRNMNHEKSAFQGDMTTYEVVACGCEGLNNGRLIPIHSPVVGLRDFPPS